MNLLDLANQAKKKASEAWSATKPYNVFANVPQLAQGAGQAIQQFQNSDANVFKRASEGTLPNTPQALKPAQQFVGSFLNNNVVNPILNTGVSATQFAQKPTAGNALNTAMGALNSTPQMIGWNSTVTPLVRSATAGIQGIRTNQNPIQSAYQGVTGQKQIGLGDALTDNKTLATIGNFAEIPLSIAGGKGANALRQTPQIQKLIGAKTPMHPEDMQFLYTAMDNLKSKNPKLIQEGKNTIYNLAERYLDDKQLQKSNDNAQKLFAELAKYAENKPNVLGNFRMGLVDQKPPNLPMEGGNAPGQYILRQGQKKVSVVASPTTKNVLKLKDQKAQLGQAEADYKEWSNALGKQEGVRTTNQAINDLGKAIDLNTTKAEANRFAQSRTGKTLTSKGGDTLAKEIIDSTDTWKDKPTRLQYGRETLERNIEDIAGPSAPIIKEKFINPIKSNEGERIRWLNTERQQIASLGIKSGSQESSLLQQFGEKKITLEQLKQQAPQEWPKIAKADEVLRSKYDQYLNDINAVLKRNGYDPIPKREDYYRHFEEVSGVLGQIGIPNLNDKLPTDLAGLTADFKPGKNFFANALPRKGDKTSFDAIKGIDGYLEGASKQIYHTDDIQRLRLLEKAIREKHAGTQHLSNFVADLGEYTNNLAGKKAMLDRAVESTLGRGMFSVLDRVRKQFGANAVGANISSALTNYIPLTQALATTDKPSFVKGMAQVMARVGKDDGFVQRSDFLTKRLGSDSIAKTKWDNVADRAGWLFKTIDGFTSETIVRAKYLEGLKKGLDDTTALKQADDWASRVMGSRALGETPTLFNTKTLGFLTQFQLELNNQLSFLAKDIPRNFDKKGTASALAQVAIYSYLFNNLYEKLTGNRPALDPIGITQQSYEDYTNPNMPDGKATSNLIDRLSNSLPFTSLATGGGRIPALQNLPDVIGMAKGEVKPVPAITKAVASYALPFGGGQIKKSIEGAQAYMKGESTSPAGNVRFPIGQNAENAIKSTVFGQWATPEGKKYIREGAKPLGKEQSQEFRDGGGIETFNQVMEDRAQNKADKKAEEQGNGGFLDNMFQNIFGAPKEADAADDSVANQTIDQYVEDNSSGLTPVEKRQKADEMKTLRKELKRVTSPSNKSLTTDAKNSKAIEIEAKLKSIKDSLKPNKDYSNLQITGDEELDKKIISKQSSDITDSINVVIDALNNGKISKEEAIKKVNELEGKRAELKKTNKVDYSNVVLTGEGDLDKAIISKQITESNAELQDITESYAKGRITKEEAESRIDEIKDQIKSLKQKKSGGRKLKVASSKKPSVRPSGTKKVSIQGVKAPRISISVKSPGIKLSAPKRKIAIRKPKIKNITLKKRT